MFMRAPLHEFVGLGSSITERPREGDVVSDIGSERLATDGLGRQPPPGGPSGPRRSNPRRGCLRSARSQSPEHDGAGLFYGPFNSRWRCSPLRASNAPV